jgi:hypothetical protein
VAWWRIDPRTGQAVGVMDTGLLAAMTEDAIDNEVADSEIGVEAQGPMPKNPPGPAARAWANHAERMRAANGGSTSDSQLQNLANYAQYIIEKTGSMPSI